MCNIHREEVQYSAKLRSQRPGEIELKDSGIWISFVSWVLEFVIQLSGSKEADRWEKRHVLFTALMLTDKIKSASSGSSSVVELLPSKQDVEGSSPFSRSIIRLSSVLYTRAHSTPLLKPGKT